MTDPVQIERHGDIAVVLADQPPVNALGIAVRRGLARALRDAGGDDRVAAIVIRCAGRTFFAGADIAEFDAPPVDPQLRDVIALIETIDKPVVAAIHGTALGGGCELALGCHYRLAVPSARIGTPEVKLGLIPGAGGTQRLPRLVGVDAALRLVATGEPVPASRAAELGLVDMVVAEAELAAAAIAFARQVATSRPLPRIRDRPAAPDPEAIAAFRAANARKLRGFEAPEAAIACIEKAGDGSSFEDGMAFERAAFLRLRDGSQSKAQRHLFFAERQAAKIADVPADTPRRPIRKVGVIGAGTMGGGIGMNFLSAGLAVTIVETSREALDRGCAVIRRNYEATAAKGRLTTEAVDAAMARLTPALDLAALADCDLVIEAVYEDIEVKKALFGRIDAVARPGAILASNTSYLSIDEIAAVTGRPQDVVGTHFFSPANVMKLLEVVRGAQTAPDVLATMMDLARTIGKIAVVAGVTHGFIGNRMLIPRQKAATDLLLEGVPPERIDRVHTDFGMPMGPFQMIDLAGVDIGWHRDPARIETIRDALNAEGRWGQKTGAGFYDYDESRRPTPSPRVAEIVERFRSREGRPQRDVDDREILERTLYPLINEGALILEQGFAQRASDIDVVWVHGYGWPAYRGGPMFYAGTIGWDRIVAGLERFGIVPAASIGARLSNPG